VDVVGFDLVVKPCVPDVRKDPLQVIPIVRDDIHSEPPDMEAVRMAAHGLIVGS